MRLAYSSCYAAKVHRFGSCINPFFLLVLLLLLRDIPRFFVYDERSTAGLQKGAASWMIFC